MTNSSQATPIITCDGLYKTYGTIDAVNNLSLTINKGDIFGLVGANGSGKTTLIRILTGLTHPTKGSFKLLKGENEQKLKIGAIVEQPSLYLNLTGQKNIEIACDLANVSSTNMVKKLMTQAGLNPKLRSVVKKYSLGMKQRLAIAMALVNNPDILILDEPTNGLDPQGIVEIRKFLLKLNQETGITILISSHILTELGKIANRFMFIDHGEKIKECTIDEIENECKSDFIACFSDNKKAEEALQGKLDFKRTDKHLAISSPITLTQLVKMLEGTDIEVISGDYAPLDLESYFFKLLKREGNHNE